MTYNSIAGAVADGDPTASYPSFGSGLVFNSVAIPASIKIDSALSDDLEFSLADTELRTRTFSLSLYAYTPNGETIRLFGGYEINPRNVDDKFPTGYDPQNFGQTMYFPGGTEATYISREAAAVIPDGSLLMLAVDSVTPEDVHVYHGNTEPVDPVNLRPIRKLPNEERDVRRVWIGRFDDAASITLDSDGNQISISQFFMRYDPDVRIGDVFVDSGRTFWLVTELNSIDRDAYLQISVQDVSGEYA